MAINNTLIEAYKGKKVFITGHTGFKGTWLLSILHMFGANVKGYALAPQDNSLFKKIKGNELCQSIISDIRDKKALQKEITSFSPDFIFHLAAQPLVLDSLEDPLYTYEVNVMGTVNLLHSCLPLASKCSVVIVTTDKVYHNLENKKAFKEDDSLGGLDPYSGSKACSEIVTTSFRHSFFQNHKVKIASARAGNVIGGGDYAKNRIIPDIVQALSLNRDVIIRNPNAIRPWQHVLDCLNGYLMLAKRNYEDEKFYKSQNQAWNFGPSQKDEMNVLDLTKLVIDTWGTGGYKLANQSKKPHEAKYLILDNRKSIEYLDWQPKWNSEDAVKKTVEWFKNLSDSTLLNMEDHINLFFQR